MSIDLKTIDAEVAALAGRSPRTPIGMKELWDEVQNLKGSVGNAQIVHLDVGGGSGHFDKTFSIPNNNSIIVLGKIVYAYNNRGAWTTFSMTGVLKKGQSQQGSIIWTDTGDNDFKRPVTITNNGTSIRVQFKDRTGIRDNFLKVIVI